MPRNSSGVYSTPAGQPAIGGTVISSATHNSLTGDLAQEITSSLDRSGRGPMLAPLRTPSGSVTAPTHSFSDEATSGLYRAGAGDVRMSIAGVDKAKWTAVGEFATKFCPLGATANGVVLDNAAGNPAADKIASFRIDGGEKAYFDKDGRLSTPGLLGAGNRVTSSSSGAFSTSSASYVDVTGVSLSFTASGRPVLLIIQPAAGTFGRIVQGNAASNVGIKILRDAAHVAEWTLGAAALNAQFPGSLLFLDAPAAGTYTYKAQMFSGGGAAAMTNCVLVAFEL